MILSGIIEKEHKHCKKITTRKLIALCEMENYDIFCKELEELIKTKTNKDLIDKMYDIMQGKFRLKNKKYKDFVKKYDYIIEIMKKYNCLWDMTVGKYDAFGNAYKDSTEDFFCKFLIEHSDDIEKIKSIAIKINQLGFDEIIYGEKLDFTGIEYELEASYENEFEYLENIEVVPTYDNTTIKYKTTNSCYRMTIGTTGYGYTKRIKKYSKKIELNSLIFDVNRLPDEITIESTIGYINKLVELSKNDYQCVRDLVNINVSIEDLVNQYNYLKNIIENVENVKNKEEMKQVLYSILEEVEKLKSECLSFQKSIIVESDRIDESRVDEEKKLYLERRKKVSYY